jgi:hypothetical protein
MAVTIMINPGASGLTLCHKGSDGRSVATVPNVCNTSQLPVPVPYPNIAFSRDLVKGTTTVQADGGNMCANFGSEFSKSTGDEAGSAGGVKSSVFTKEASWITYSFDVKIEGKGASRLSDKMFHNHHNTVSDGETQAPLKAFEPCTIAKMKENIKKCAPDVYEKATKELGREPNPTWVKDGDLAPDKLGVTDEFGNIELNPVMKGFGDCCGPTLILLHELTHAGQAKETQKLNDGVRQGKIGEEEYTSASLLAERDAFRAEARAFKKCGKSWGATEDSSAVFGDAVDFKTGELTPGYVDIHSVISNCACCATVLHWLA